MKLITAIDKERLVIKCILERTQ